MIEKEQNMEYNKGCKGKIDDDTRHLKRKERWVDYQDIRSTRGELFPRSVITSINNPLFHTWM